MLCSQCGNPFRDINSAGTRMKEIALEILEQHQRPHSFWLCPGFETFLSHCETNTLIICQNGQNQDDQNKQEGSLS